jgi:hypothetical protein
MASIVPRAAGKRDGQRDENECNSGKNDPSEAQPKTIARKGTRLSGNNEPTVLSASLRRPLRVRCDLQTRKIALVDHVMALTAQRPPAWIDW